MEKERSEEVSTSKRNWKDYFDLFKYLVPFLIYFLVVWLNTIFATKEELMSTNANVINATKLSERAIEENKDLQNSLYYEIKLIDNKLENISTSVEEVKKLVEEHVKNQ